MSDPSPNPPVVPGPVEGPDSEAPPHGANGGRTAVPNVPVALILAAGVVAGLAAWLGGEACRDLIKARRHVVNSRGIILYVVSHRDQDIADARNAGLAFAWLGACLGAALGAVGGLARRSGRAAMSAAGVGAVAGALACAAVSMVVLPLYTAYRNGHPDEASRDLLFPLLVHAGIWSVAGAVGGLAFGLGLGRGERGVWTQAALGGFVGAAIAAAAYELIGVAAFPGAATTQFISRTWPTRLMARLAVGILAAAGVALAIAPPRERPVSPAP